MITQECYTPCQHRQGNSWAVCWYHLSGQTAWPTHSRVLQQNYPVDAISPLTAPHHSMLHNILTNAAVHHRHHLSIVNGWLLLTRSRKWCYGKRIQWGHSLSLWYMYNIKQDGDITRTWWYDSDITMTWWYDRELKLAYKYELWHQSILKTTYFTDILFLMHQVLTHKLPAFMMFRILQKYNIIITIITGNLYSTFRDSKW